MTNLFSELKIQFYVIKKDNVGKDLKLKEHKTKEIIIKIEIMRQMTEQ